MNNSNHTSNTLHDQAMHLANQAMDASKKDDATQAKQYFKEAYQLEQQAAMTLVNDFEQEPSRSVLFRSAAYLALKAELYREAERMAAFGLSGNPPNEIADELRDVFSKSVEYLKMVA